MAFNSFGWPFRESEPEEPTPSSNFFYSNYPPLEEKSPLESLLQDFIEDTRATQLALEKSLGRLHPQEDESEVQSASIEEKSSLESLLENFIQESRAMN